MIMRSLDRENAAAVVGFSFHTRPRRNLIFIWKSKDCYADLFHLCWKADGDETFSRDDDVQSGGEVLQLSIESDEHMTSGCRQSSKVVPDQLYEGRLAKRKHVIGYEFDECESDRYVSDDGGAQNLRRHRPDDETVTDDDADDEDDRNGRVIQRRYPSGGRQ